MISNGFVSHLVLETIFAASDVKTQRVLRNVVERWGLPNNISQDYVGRQWRLFVRWQFWGPDLTPFEDEPTLESRIETKYENAYTFENSMFWVHKGPLAGINDQPVQWLISWQAHFDRTPQLTKGDRYVCEPVEPLLHELLRSHECCLTERHRD